MLRQTDGLFRDGGRARRGAEFPDVPLEVQIVDDFARRLVAEPHTLDVVVLPNLYGDILSDAAAGLVGGLGLAPSGCYGDGYAYFEPAHGTAPDLAGRGTINPTATLLSAAMLLEHLGLARRGRAPRGGGGPRLRRRKGAHAGPGRERKRGGVLRSGRAGARRLRCDTVSKGHLASESRKVALIEARSEAAGSCFAPPFLLEVSGLRGARRR